jgi:hypothetical protein
VIESVIENGAKRGRWLSGYRVIEEVRVYRVYRVGVSLSVCNLEATTKEYNGLESTVVYIRPGAANQVTWITTPQAHSRPINIWWIGLPIESRWNVSWTIACMIEFYPCQVLVNARLCVTSARNADYLNECWLPEWDLFQIRLWR